MRWVDSYYIQGWLATKLEATGQTQAAWRVDPKRAGGSGCGGDIGTHALMQLRYVTGLEIPQLSAQLETFVEGRKLDDHFTIYCKLSNGGKALVRASQICIGHKNDFTIDVAGTKGTLTGARKSPRASPSACRTSRTASIGAAAWLRATASCPRTFPPTCWPSRPFRGATPRASTMRSPACIAVSRPMSARGRPASLQVRRHKYANVEDGWMGIAFIETCVKSSKKKGAWTPMAKAS